MKTLDAQTLRTMMSQSDEPLVINVLPSDAFAEEHIPDSHNVPVGLDNFAEQVERLAGDKSRTIVVYCASKQCDASPTAARKLEEAGFTDISDFEGGMKEWTDKGFVVGQAAT